VLTHNYDSGGKLSSLQGVKGDFTYDYLKTMTYDKFGQRVFTKYANDTTATYSYEEDRRRLSNIIATDTSRIFMDNSYSYDNMQNILGVSNAAAVPAGSSEFGGETSQSFSYDNLYQLKNAEGSWTARQGHQYRYNLEMGYDTIGNIKSKRQLHEKLPYDGDKWVEEHKTTYDWTYDHTAKQPHAPTKIGNRTFSYDLNGNQTGWENTLNANNRVIEWDEENRITTVSDNGHTSYYVYDAGGERTLKRSAQGETFYVNPYFVIREGQVASKHFFAGSQRVATKLTKQESQTVHGKGGNDKPAKIIYEKEQYFYHPDHLGSSSFVTDEKGEVYEHLEYFPFGETFAHEHSNTQVTPYRFTGKELDEVTGLYYYGARYYDPRTSVWQSPDPILNEYMSGQTNGGVFNPSNLSLFTYTYNNPVNLVDPDGNSPISVLAKQIVKQGIKEGLKTYANKQIKGRLSRYMTKDMSKQFKKDLDDVLGSLDSSWWEVGLELVPVAGDLYGATKFGKKIAGAHKKLQALENKYVGEIADKLKNTPAGKKFKKNMRNAGVRDARKDQSEGVDGLGIKYEKGQGIEGHHKELVSENPSRMSDPSNLEFMKKEDHIKVHQGE
jgi:RHS repeat-associated protein